MSLSTDDPNRLVRRGQEGDGKPRSPASRGHEVSAPANGISVERAMKQLPHVSKRTAWDDVTAELEELRRETEIQRADLMALENARVDQGFAKARSLFANGREPVSRYAANASYAGSLSVVSLSQGRWVSVISACSASRKPRPTDTF